MTPPPPSAAGPLRASGLPRGARGLVTGVDGADETRERLAALGLVPGASLQVLRAGSPMAVAVGEARFALGRSWAEALLVQPL